MSMRSQLVSIVLSEYLQFSNKVIFMVWMEICASIHIKIYFLPEFWYIFVYDHCELLKKYLFYCLLSHYEHTRAFYRMFGQARRPETQEPPRKPLGSRQPRWRLGVSQLWALRIFSSPLGSHLPLAMRQHQFYTHFPHVMTCHSPLSRCCPCSASVLFMLYYSLPRECAMTDLVS